MMYSNCFISNELWFNRFVDLCVFDYHHSFETQLTNLDLYLSSRNQDLPRRVKQDPETLNPKSLNPKPKSVNPKKSALLPTLNPQPAILDTQLGKNEYNL